jgi:hypothetical protein
MLLALAASSLGLVAQQNQTKSHGALESLPGPTRALVTKKAKHLFRLPDGAFLDTENFDAWQEALAKNLFVFEDYDDHAGAPADTTGRIGWHEKTLRATSLRIRESEDSRARGIWPQVYNDGLVYQFPGDGPVPVQMWSSSRELACKAVFGDRRGARERPPWPRMTSVLAINRDCVPEASNAGGVFYLVGNAYSKMANHDGLRSEAASPEVVLVHAAQSVYLPTGQPRGKWSEDPTPSTFACQANPKVFVKGRLKASALILTPALDGAGANATQRIVMVGGRSLPLFDAHPTDELRMSTEDIAKAAAAGEMQLVEWSRKKIGEGYQWTARVAEATPAKPTSAPPP